MYREAASILEFSKTIKLQNVRAAYQLFASGYEDARRKKADAAAKQNSPND